MLWFNMFVCTLLSLFWTRLNEMGCGWPQLTTMQRQSLRLIGGKSLGSQTPRDPATPRPRQPTAVSHRGLIPDVSGRPPKNCTFGKIYCFLHRCVHPRLLAPLSSSRSRLPAEWCRLCRVLRFNMFACMLFRTHVNEVGCVWPQTHHDDASQ